MSYQLVSHRFVAFFDLLLRLKVYLYHKYNHFIHNWSRFSTIQSVGIVNKGTEEFLLEAGLIPTDTTRGNIWAKKVFAN